MAVKGAADMLADARAAVRNSASRRVIGPVICVLKMSALALPRDTTLPALRQAGTACECPAEREKLAYEAQDHWLHLFGHNLEAEFEVDGLWFRPLARWRWGCTEGVGRCEQFGLRCVGGCARQYCGDLDAFLLKARRRTSRPRAGVEAANRKDGCGVAEKKAGVSGSLNWFSVGEF
jgi:hypothetical protein